MNSEETFDRMRAMPVDTMEFKVERVTIEEGRSFSKDAMKALQTEIMLWVGSRVMYRWDTTGEPPTALKVTVTVEAA